MAVKNEEPAAEAEPLVFRVESIQREMHGTILLNTVVIAPEKGNNFFGTNPVARIELSRLTAEAAKEYKPGARFIVKIEKA